MKLMFLSLTSAATVLFTLGIPLPEVEADDTTNAANYVDQIYKDQQQTQEYINQIYKDQQERDDYLNSLWQNAKPEETAVPQAMPFTVPLQAAPLPPALPITPRQAFMLQQSQRWQMMQMQQMQRLRVQQLQQMHARQ